MTANPLALLFEGADEVVAEMRRREEAGGPELLAVVERLLAGEFRLDQVTETYRYEVRLYVRGPAVAIPAEDLARSDG